MMKKMILGAVAVFAAFTLAACSSNNADTITVITREDGSGTRGAFTEITGIATDDGDMTTLDAIVQDGTGKVMTAVAADDTAIGYISLGSLNDTVKAVTVDGVVPSSETILDGTYKVARPFNIATAKGKDLSPLAQDFLAYIFTTEGQQIVLDNGFVPVDATSTNYTSTAPNGVLTIGGSTSVYPLMEKLAEAYKVINPNATINIEGIGSSAGMKGAIEGTFDIGMASRELKSSEKEVLDGTPIAMDGIAVVVHPKNNLKDLSVENIKKIYTGEITEYNQLG